MLGPGQCNLEPHPQRLYHQRLVLHDLEPVQRCNSHRDLFGLPGPDLGRRHPTANWATDAATCAAAPLLQAQETFDDYPPNAVVSPQPAKCSVVNTCGQTQNQVSWLWRPIVPMVSSVSGASGSSNGGAQFTINGTGFVQGSTVNLVWQTGPSAESWTYPPNLTMQPQTDENGVGTIVQATNVQVNPAGTQITATAPAVTTGPYFFVTVTTPGGTERVSIPADADVPSLHLRRSGASNCDDQWIWVRNRRGVGHHHGQWILQRRQLRDSGMVRPKRGPGRSRQCHSQRDRNVSDRHLAGRLFTRHVECPSANSRRDEYANRTVRHGCASADHHEFESPSSAANPTQLTISGATSSLARLSGSASPPQQM